MATKIVKEQLRDFALQNTDADMVGFANIERFDTCPDEFHPRNLNRRVRTVIVIGMRIIRGAVRSMEQGTGRICYNAYGYGGINGNWMPDVLHKLAVHIEDHGYEAVPVVQWTGMPPLEPIIDHRLAAIAAGLGERGHSKVFLTDQFGPLQRLGILLTDAEIDPDPIRVGTLCDGCMKCVQDCPVNAISANETEEVEIEGHLIKWGKLDVFLCGIAHPGAHPATTPFIPEEGFDISEEIAWAQERLTKVNSDIERRGIAEEVAVKIKEKYHHPIHLITHAIGGSRSMCGARGCMRSCLAHLEQEKRIETGFNQLFRAPGEEAESMNIYTKRASNAVVQHRNE